VFAALDALAKTRIEREQLSERVLRLTWCPAERHATAVMRRL
jgi:hypothetical protein